MSTFRIKSFTSISGPRFDFLSTLADIGHQADKKFPNARSLALVVEYRPKSRDIQATLDFGWSDCDYLIVDFTRSGTIVNQDDPRETFSNKQLLGRLIQVCQEIQKDNRPGISQKLNWIEKELKNYQGSQKSFSQNLELLGSEVTLKDPKTGQEIELQASQFGWLIKGLRKVTGANKVQQFLDINIGGQTVGALILERQKLSGGASGLHIEVHYGPYSKKLEVNSDRYKPILDKYLKSILQFTIKSAKEAGFEKVMYDLDLSDDATLFKSLGFKDTGEEANEEVFVWSKDL